MNNHEKRPPTWVKADSNGSQFLTYDGDLTPIQLQTLDKIVENIELCYDYNAAKRSANTNNDDYAELSESYMYKKAKDPIGHWHWRDATDRTYYKLPNRVSSIKLNGDRGYQNYQKIPSSGQNNASQDLSQGSYLYNCFSKDTSSQVRAYLNKLYFDLIEKADKPWAVKQDVDEVEEEVEEISTSQSSAKVDEEIPKEKQSPFPKIIPLTSEQKPRSIMKDTSNRLSTKYEQKLLDVYSNLTKEKMKQQQKKEDGFDTDHSLTDDVFHPSSSSGIASTSIKANETPSSKPDHQRSSVTSIASSSRMENNDDTDLDQDESASMPVPIYRRPQLNEERNGNGSMKAVSGFVSEKPEPRKVYQAAPLNEPPSRDIYSRRDMQIPTRDIRPAREESSNYFQFPPVNQQRQQQQQQKPQRTAPSKLGRLSENAERIVENINNRFQPSKTQLGRIKDVSEPPETKIKFLSNFSSKFIEKANKLQHKR